ncbi:GntR family transcriptional regulator [Sphingomonas profundi]|uniref:GntR family transcriptional regulator n=1 Tax=Alterirhizorhabdus profundi TaxID=2681549 RepID=UPI0012E976EE|nr:GntR family transcriptional regulator [Sphingomonas profundi]
MPDHSVKPDYSEANISLEERQDSLVGQIAAEIARAISEGELAPGADLNSVELATRFGTSRTPVREALMLLEREGLVEIPPRRRPRVAHISMSEVEELYQIRATLNAMMIRLFVANATQEDLDESVSLYEAMASDVAAGEYERFQEHRRQLHNHWPDRCGNLSLKKLLNTWKMRMSVGRLVGPQVQDAERLLLDHQRLVMACIEREADVAASLLRSMTLFGLHAIQRKHRDRGQVDALARPVPKAGRQLHIV